MFSLSDYGSWDKATTTESINNVSDDGEVTSSLLSGALSLVPFGSIIDTVLGFLDIGSNINLLLKYGFSSWGASMSPEEMKKKFGEFVYPYVQSSLESIRPENAETVINKMVTDLYASMYTSRRLSKTSRADSSKQGYAWGAKEYEKIINESLTNGLFKELQKVGVEPVKSTYQSRVTDTGGFNLDRQEKANHIETYTFYKYKLDASGVNVTTDKPEEGEDVGTVKAKKSGLGSLVKVGGVVYGAIQLLK